jgi:prophage tail gpP-like protein
MPNSETIRLVVSGQELTGWTGATIDMSIATIADAFSLSTPYDPTDSKIASLLKPFGYQKAEVYVGDEILVKGIIEHLAPSLESGQRILTIQGRSLTGQLVDCSIDGALEHSGLTLAAIARQLCRPFGIAVRADTDSPVIEHARAEYGETVASYLGRLASVRNILLGTSFKGELVLYSATALKSAPVRASLVEGIAPVLSVSAQFDATSRYSLYRAATQFAGEPDIVGTVTDPGVSLHRPHLGLVPDSDIDPNKTASRLRAEANVKAITATVSLAGWRRPDGQRWSERQAVTLKAPSAMLSKEAAWIISSASYKLDANGQSVNLDLVLPETYAGENPKVQPWA